LSTGDDGSTDTVSFSVAIVSGTLTSDSTGVSVNALADIGQDSLIGFDFTRDRIVLNATGINQFSHLTSVEKGAYNIQDAANAPVTNFGLNVGLIDWNNDGNFSDFAISFLGADGVTPYNALTIVEFRSVLQYSILGTELDDSIVTGDLDDWVWGGDGFDIIALGAGNDTVRGGKGADRIDVGTGFDTGFDTVVISVEDISNLHAGQTGFKDSADLIIGLSNGDGLDASDKLDLDQLFGNNAMPDLKVINRDITAPGALSNLAGGVLFHTTAIDSPALDASNVVNQFFVDAAIAILKTPGAALDSDFDSDAYVVFRDNGGAAGAFDPADLAIFRVDHSKGSGTTSTTILDSEITLVAILKDFGQSLTNGFII
jgi:hypothetical protein